MLRGFHFAGGAFITTLLPPVLQNLIKHCNKNRLLVHTATIHYELYVAFNSFLTINIVMDFVFFVLASLQVQRLLD